MKVLIFGATGMVGLGVLRECLLDAGVDQVVTIGRSVTGQQNPKLREIVQKDLSGYPDTASQLTGFDACLFCLGVSSAGMNEQDYRHLTYDLTMVAARTLVKLNPEMTFIYVSGAGTDSSERGRSMWARVKGKTENDLLALPFRGVYAFRPAVIQPLHGIRSKTKAYQILYFFFGWTIPLLKPVLFPKYMTTTEQIGKAMLKVARQGYAKRILESVDINAV
jgi:uncharacterized protein YbjT (DUF2867 family)